jgi:hypothetical protein
VRTQADQYKKSTTVVAVDFRLSLWVRTNDAGAIVLTAIATLQHALAAVSLFVAIAKFDRFVFASRSARGNRRDGERPRPLGTVNSALTSITFHQGR